jgi:TRAP-type uncharacterized transport system fused permease subunit
VPKLAGYPPDLQILLFATVPTLLYYLGILAIGMDSRRYRTSGVEVDTRPLGWLLLRYGYYVSSLVLIVVFMAFGLSPFRAVLYATVVAFALGFLRRETRWTPRRVFDWPPAPSGSCRWWRCAPPPGSSWPWSRSPAWA